VLSSLEKKFWGERKKLQAVSEACLKTDHIVPDRRTTEGTSLVFLLKAPGKGTFEANAMKPSQSSWQSFGQGGSRRGVGGGQVMRAPIQLGKEDKGVARSSPRNAHPEEGAQNRKKSGMRRGIRGKFTREMTSDRKGDREKTPKNGLGGRLFQTNTRKRNMGASFHREEGGIKNGRRVSKVDGRFTNKLQGKKQFARNYPDHRGRYQSQEARKGMTSVPLC